MQIFGHRGSTRPGPENTLVALEGCLAAGAGLEVDVRRSADERLVLCHDPVIEGRTIVRTPYAELAGLGVPLLTDALDLASGRAPVICEVKSIPGEPDFDAPAERTAALLLELLARRSGLDDVVVSSFDWYAVERARDAGLPTGFLSWQGVKARAALAYVTDAGHPQLHAHLGALLDDPDAVALAHQSGVAVLAWTVDTVEQAEQLRQMGADGFICEEPAALVPAFG